MRGAPGVCIVASTAQGDHRAAGWRSGDSKMQLFLLTQVATAAYALSARTVAPPRVVVDLDVVADTLPLESEIYLSALQELRPTRQAMP